MTDTDPGAQAPSLDPERRAAVLALLHQRRAAERRAADDTIPVLVRDGRPSPVSFAQARVLFLEEFDPDTAQHNMPHAFTLDGPLDEAALQRALDEVSARHEALRTAFPRSNGQWSQLVTHPAPVPLPQVDLSGQPEQERAAMARAVLAEEAQRPFDLERGPLFRARLIRLAQEQAILFLDFHHAVCDGWSVGRVMADLAACYRASVAGEGAAVLDPLPVQYRDYAAWQRERLGEPELRRGLDFWQAQLTGVPALELPTDRPRPPVRGHRGALVTVEWPRELLDGLTALARECEATLFAVLLAGYQCLLARSAGQHDFAVGTMVAGRNRPELEPTVGLFANTVVLRADLSGQPAFTELVRRARDGSLAAWDHQEVPFERVVDALEVPRDLSRTALFQAMLVLQNTPPAAFTLPGLTVGAVEPDSRTAKTDLTLYVTEPAPGGSEGLTVAAEFSADLFESASVRALLERLRTLLAAAVAAPDTTLDALPLLTADRLATLTAAQQATPITELTVDQLLRQRAAERPDAPAVSAPGAASLSYAELDRAADRLAHHLAARGAGPGQLVGVALERGTDLPVALLAVLRTGAAYVPLDPDYPAARLAVMTEDAGLALTVTTGRLAARIPVPREALVLLDEHAAAIAAGPAGPLPEVASPDHTAYVIFTSGSTGRPKGVRIAHRSLVNLLGSAGQRCGIGAGDTLLAVTSLSFDIAGLELWAPLVAGGHLVVCDRQSAAAADQLAKVLAEYRPTVMQATPATWRLLTDAGWPGDPALTVLCGGERLPEDLGRTLRPLVKALWNMYGPTETTIWSAAGPVEFTEDEDRVPIGPPLANTDLHVLDPRLVPQPDGVAGEVWIGGAGLAEAYHGRPALTADRFRPHPFAATPGARIYRTGDLARRRPDGRLDFLGRLDDQVKVRGYRIELGDVEAALAAHPKVAQAVAAVRATAAGERLVGYLVAAPGTEPTVTELRAHLKEVLPDYMVPALFATVPAFPLTPNGKIDRRALPAPEQAATASGTVYQEPEGPVEQALAAIWQELLSVERVGRQDDFFALGGDSLLVVRMVGAAAQQEIRLTAKQAFQHKTLVELAAAAGTVKLLARQDAITGPSPLPVATHQFFESAPPRPDYHALSFLLRAREPLDPALLDEVLDQLVGHHDTLRLRLTEQDGRLGLTHDPHRRRPLVEQVDLAGLDDEAVEQEIQRHTDRMQTRFTMTGGELFGALLFDLGPGRDQRLLLAGHYLIADVIGWQILAGDLDVLYRRRAHDEPYQLPAKTTSQHEWLGRLTEYATGQAAAERDYWLAPARSRAVPLPQDHPEGDNRVAANRALFLTLSTDQTEALLRRANKAAKLPLDAILLWALVSALGEWAGTETLPVDLYVPGRESPWEDVDLSRTVGWLTYRYPVWLDRARALPPAEAVREVSRQLKAVPQGGLGHGALRYFGTDRATAEALAAQPVPELMFNFFGTPAGGFQLFQPLAGDSGHYHDTESRRMRLLMVNGAVAHGRLRLEWEYSAGRHEESTIQHLIDRCTALLVELTANCPESDRD
ncbi:non-ribosomal peptide synthetase [Kitasatospora sp. NBC_01302]|uniref:non-ribosomal peptide synthetase n=1 Tax=Kitasatospora sp. NBC_01302 TaxID=2903575 RepID=UPI002E0D96A4|nr:non-ribosomal peptide synthetase [Kitasatospora sp. NBC_01302]WSJ65336.1 amino acid adenylation domain-containing protein [Kitasatospora sp. NBC_01302]